MSLFGTFTCGTGHGIFCELNILYELVLFRKGDFRCVKCL